MKDGIFDILLKVAIGTLLLALTVVVMVAGATAIKYMIHAMNTAPVAVVQPVAVEDSKITELNGSRKQLHDGALKLYGHYSPNVEVLNTKIAAVLLASDWTNQQAEMLIEDLVLDAIHLGLPADYPAKYGKKITDEMLGGKNED